MWEYWGEERLVGVMVKMGVFLCWKGGQRLYGFMKRGAATHSWSRLYVLIADFLYPSKFYRFFRRNEMSCMLWFVMYVVEREAIHVLIDIGRRNQSWMDVCIVEHQIGIRDYTIYQ